VVENSGSYPDFNNLSKTKSPDYSAQKKITAEKKYANARFIVSDLVPLGTVTNLFEDKLGTRGPDEIIAVSAKETLKDGKIRRGRMIVLKYTVLSIVKNISGTNLKLKRHLS
jgi:hypothetical protein